MSFYYPDVFMTEYQIIWNILIWGKVLEFSHIHIASVHLTEICANFINYCTCNSCIVHEGCIKDVSP